MHQHAHALSSGQINRMFYLGMALNLGFTAFEYAAGLYAHSLALIADASHNLSDVAGLFISMLALKLSARPAQQKLTYGYRKASILAALINAVLILWIVIQIFLSIYHRLRLEATPSLETSWVSTVALVGVVVNFSSAFLFFRAQKQDLNIRGAFLHLLLDGLVSLGVFASGILIAYTGWMFVDLVMSFIIALVIITATWGLLKESVLLILDGVPRHLDVGEVVRRISSIEKVVSVHHIHLWALSSTQNALTAHIVLEAEGFAAWQEIKAQIHQSLAPINITHLTLQPELKFPPCPQQGSNCGSS